MRYVMTACGALGLLAIAAVTTQGIDHPGAAPTLREPYDWPANDRHSRQSWLGDHCKWDERGNAFCDR